MSGHSHRPHLKQQNKPFKSGHASKGALKQAAKGRLPGSNPSAGGSSKSSSTNHLSTAQTKLNRRNTTKQLQQQKRAALVRDQRLFSGRGGVPRVVCVVELGEGTDGRRCVRELAGVLGEEGEGLEVDGKGVVNVRCVYLPSYSRAASTGQGSREFREAHVCCLSPFSLSG
jgi:pre-rRNA-processing protein TSR1